MRTGRPLAGAERELAERLGIVEHVIELRGVSDDQLPALYNAVDLLLFPSLYEGFGWPPLEAMASGTPVVCSRAGSLGDVVGDAALTADPEDTAALTWHAAAALTDPALRRALIARGLAHVEQFSWAHTAECSSSPSIAASWGRRPEMCGIVGIVRWGGEAVRSEADRADVRQHRPPRA